jgi:hypothetical protein
MSLSVDQLEAMAQSSFSSFGGEDTLDIMSFLGEGNDLLDFDGMDVENFVGQNSDRQFSIVLDSNNDSKVLKCLLFAGYKERALQEFTLAITTAAVTNVTAEQKFTAITKPRGVVRDGFFIDLNGFGTSLTVGSTGGLTATANELKSIEELQEWVKLHPSKVIAIQITSDSELQLKQNFIIRKHNPFKETETTMLRPSNYQDQDTIQSKTVVFPVDNLTLDALTQLEYSVVPNATVNINFVFGASASLSRFLDKQAKRAQSAIRATGGPGKLRTIANQRRLLRGR